MKRWQFFIVLGLALVCLGLSVAAVISGRANQKLQAELQTQQAEINRGNLSQQVGTSLVRDIAVARRRTKSCEIFSPATDLP